MTKLTTIIVNYFIPLTDRVALALSGKKPCDINFISQIRKNLTVN